MKPTPPDQNRGVSFFSMDYLQELYPETAKINLYPVLYLALIYFLYVAYGADGIKIFDVSVPETAYLFSEFDTDGNCQDIVVRDKYAYIADNAQGITIAKLW